MPCWGGNKAELAKIRRTCTRRFKAEPELRWSLTNCGFWTNLSILSLSLPICQMGTFMPSFCSWQEGSEGEVKLMRPSVPELFTKGLWESPENGGSGRFIDLSRVSVWGGTSLI